VSPPAQHSRNRRDNALFRIAPCHCHITASVVLPVLECFVRSFRVCPWQSRLIGKIDQGLDGSIHITHIALYVPREGGIGHDLFVPAEIGFRHAIDLADSHRHVQLLNLHGKLFPGRRQLVALNRRPGCKQ
jgi:hypothetical protein